jgi:hypothetical protein
VVQELPKAQTHEAKTNDQDLIAGAPVERKGQSPEFNELEELLTKN